MSRYTPRRKKICGPRVIGTMKYVRIDARTEIEVDVNIPDEEARTRYLTRLGKNVLYGFKPVGDIPVPEIMPLGSLEHLQQVIEENIELSEVEE